MSAGNESSSERTRVKALPTQAEDLLVQVHRLEASCRDLLQLDSVFDHLVSDQPTFNQICAFLDFLGDSNGSISAVLISERRKEFEPYFLAYGLLETIYSRQRTLISLLERFHISVPAGLKDGRITKPRDRIIGHPLTTGGGAHVIVRNTLTNDGFEYWSYHGGEVNRGQTVVYDEILLLHLIGMNSGLEQLHSILASIENKRRSTMRDEPIAPLLASTDYILRCVVASTIEEKYEASVEGHIQMLVDALKNVRVALLKRMRPNEVEYEMDHVLEGLKLLKEFLPLDSQNKRLRFRVVAEGVQRGYDDILRLTDEIDTTESQEISTPPP